MPPLCRHLFLFTALLPAGLLAAEPVSFNKQIQPILSEYCYHCHGPDASTRKPKKDPFRLDAEQFAFAPRGDSGPAIVKGDAAKSLVSQRIHSTDPDEVMPPPDSVKQPSAADKALLDRWIAEGAKYETHWSYLAPVKPPVPVAAGAGLTEIDHFIAANLAPVGLTLNPDEDRSRAFRRLSYDLTGLPPEPETLRHFLDDPSPDSWEKAADRLLATDASAEHFTRHWLDTVRYGDTHGIHIDNYRSIWPYRDWVIRSFKANQRFDQFTIDQMAGDLLPNPSTDQITATGYNRCMPTTGEGGAIGEEYDAVYAKDRADTMGAVWLGLTVGCASCHDHKFDPIPTKDFYSLTAFFRNTPMSSLDGNNAQHPPLLALPTPEQKSRLSALPGEIAAKQTTIDGRREMARQEFEQWLDRSATTPAEEPAKDSLALHFPLNETARVFHGTSQGKPVSWTESNNQAKSPDRSAPVAKGQAVSGEAPVIPRDGKVSYGLALRIEGKASGALLSRMDAARDFRGWDLWLSENRPAVHIIDQFPEKALKVVSKTALSPGKWHHVMAVFDGTKAGADAVSLYADGVRQEVEVENNTLGPDISIDSPLRIGSRSRGADGLEAVLTGKVAVQDVRIHTAALTADEVQRLAIQLPLREYLASTADGRTEAKKTALFERYLPIFDQSGKSLRTELAVLTEELKNVNKGVLQTLVMEEKKEEPHAFVLSRGDYRKKVDRVTAVTPSSLPPMESDWPKNRLGLAKWLVSPLNPLTARVTVNRIWSYLFGTGIVETTEDLGISGMRPVNQDLLDWQAVTFMDSGWDYRAMVKRMIMSHAYRQSAALTPRKLELDPLNLLNSRGPRFRLDAEQIRDGALAAAGLLVRNVGGPPVRPYQPEGVWEAVAMLGSTTGIYKQDKGDSLYRRSMYTLWKRTAPPASMDILNAPSREIFCTRRERTNTPLQAFVTMNDPQFVEAARQLAASAMQASPDKETRLDFITTRLLSRLFTPEERRISHRTRESALAVYTADPGAAAALIAVGESKADAALPPVDLASWTLAASQVMNMDESLTK